MKGIPRNQRFLSLSLSFTLRHISTLHTEKLIGLLKILNFSAIDCGKGHTYQHALARIPHAHAHKNSLALVFIPICV